jgi:hypothetical protein
VDVLTHLADLPAWVLVLFPLAGLVWPIRYMLQDWRNDRLARLIIKNKDGASGLRDLATLVRAQQDQQRRWRWPGSSK